MSEAAPVSSVGSPPDRVPLPEIEGELTSGAAIVAGLTRLHADSAQYWASYTTPDFFRRPSPEVWAPADQVRHLTKAVRAATVGFRLPAILLRLRFGRARFPSRSFPTLRGDYDAALERGGKSTPRFVPRPLEAHEVSDENRARLLANHAMAIETCCAAFGRWSEDALDRYRLPHPLLGLLTLREMGYFILYHNLHHVQVAERRRRG